MKQTETVVKLKKWGQNLGICLPPVVAHAARLHVNQRVRLTVEDGRIVITPVEASPTLEDRLARFDPVRHGGEAMVTESINAETW